MTTTLRRRRLRRPPVLIGGIVARPGPRPARRRHHLEPRRASACAGSRSCSSRSSSGSRPSGADRSGIALAETLRLPLFRSSFGLLLVGALGEPRPSRACSLAFVGILLNTIAIVANGGHMPIWLPSLEAAGFTPTTILLAVPRHPASDALNADFLLHAGPLGDILPIPVPFIRNVASIGDVFLTAGLGFFLFATVLRSPERGRGRGRAGPAAAAQRRSPATALLQPRRQGDRPGPARPTGDRASRPAWRRRRRSTRRSSSAPRRRPRRHRARSAGAGAGAGPSTPSGGTVACRTLREPPIEVAARIRRHPYVRLALNASFSALWAGQLISLFGDRVHQIALAFLVLGGHGLAGRGGVRLRRGDPAEPVPVADRRHVRRPLGPEGRDGRQRPARGPRSS